jgi:hypothetical protein
MYRAWERIVGIWVVLIQAFFYPVRLELYLALLTSKDQRTSLSWQLKENLSMYVSAEPKKEKETLCLGVEPSFRA